MLTQGFSPIQRVPLNQPFTMPYLLGHSIAREAGFNAYPITTQYYNLTVMLNMACSETTNKRIIWCSIWTFRFSQRDRSFNRMIIGGFFIPRDTAMHFTIVPCAIAWCWFLPRWYGHRVPANVGIQGDVTHKPKGVLNLFSTSTSRSQTSSTVVLRRCPSVPKLSTFEKGVSNKNLHQPAFETILQFIRLQYLTSLGDSYPSSINEYSQQANNDSTQVLKVVLQDE